jgi:hypothetical protein
MCVCAINEPLTNLVRESTNLQNFATFLKHFYEVKWNRDFVGLVSLLPKNFRFQEAYSTAWPLKRIWTLK